MKTRKLWIVFGSFSSGFLFDAGVVNHWYANKHPVFPLKVPGDVLGSSKEQVANRLHRFGLKKPSYYYETDFRQDRIWHDPNAAAAGVTLVTAVNAEQRLEA